MGWQETRLSLLERPWVQPYRPAYRQLKKILVLLRRFTCEPVFRARVIVSLWRFVALLWYCFYVYVIRRPRNGERPVKPGQRPKIVLLVVSQLTDDPRAWRETRTLVSSGFDVTIICPKWDADSVMPDWGPHVKVRLVPIDTPYHFFDRFFPYAYDPRLLRAALQEDDPWAFHAHGHNTILPALVAAARRRVPCTCEFREWFSEHLASRATPPVEDTWKRLRRKTYQLLEFVALRRVSAFVAAGEVIVAPTAKQDRPVPAFDVIRNAPPLSDRRSPRDERWFPTDLRAELGLAPETRILLYEGNLGPSPSLENVIRAMGTVRSAVLVIRDRIIERYFYNDYLKLAAAYGPRGKVFCLPEAGSVEARAADVGIWMQHPNAQTSDGKVKFEVCNYLNAGLPILVAGHLEAVQLVNRYHLGLAFDPNDPRAIAEAIERLAGNPDLLAACRANVRPALREMQVEREWQKLVDVYGRFGRVEPRLVATDRRDHAAVPV